MSHERKFEFLLKNRIVYRRDPVSDKPDEETNHYKLYNKGTIVDDVWSQDLDKPPKNKLRKIVFKEGCGLNRIEKLKLVGKVLGRKKQASESDIYECNKTI